MSKEIVAESQRDITYYCRLFANLNVCSTRQRGEAHYKPILLLSVIDLIAQGIIVDNKILISDELINTFNNYWNVLTSGTYKGGLHYPFFHLKHEGFWHLAFRPTFNGERPKTTNKLKEAIEYAFVDTQLFKLLEHPVYRQELTDTLVAVWFSANKKELGDILKVNKDFQNSPLFELGNVDPNPKKNLIQSVIRNAFFRKAIVHIYDYRCVFCRLRVTRSINQNIVDGAHIKPFSGFYESKIENGLALCKNHHWAFDRGWFSVDENYRIIVANDLQEESPNAKPMKEFNRAMIFLPNDEIYYPSLEALQWHRQNKFNR